MAEALYLQQVHRYPIPVSYTHLDVYKRQGLDEAGKTVAFDELQPGDLIFYSFTSNGRYKNISHGSYAYCL